MVMSDSEASGVSSASTDALNSVSAPHTGTVVLLNQSGNISPKYSTAAVSVTEEPSGIHVFHGIVERLDRLEKKVDTLLSGSVNIDSNFEDESGKPYTSSIINMSSSSPDVRAKTSAMACLHDLGFPVSSYDSVS